MCFTGGGGGAGCTTYSFQDLRALSAEEVAENAGAGNAPILLAQLGVYGLGLLVCLYVGLGIIVCTQITSCLNIYIYMYIYIYLFIYAKPEVPA